MKTVDLARLRAQVAGSRSLLALMPLAGRGSMAAMLGVLGVGALAPAAAGVATGVVVGAVQRSAVTGSSGGAVAAVVAVGLVLAVDRLTTPARTLVTAPFVRAIDLRLRERVMAATTAPPGIAHLEDPEVLNLVELSRGVSAWGGSPGQAVAGLLFIFCVRASGLASLVVLARFSWWLAVAMGGVAYLVIRTKARLYLLLSTGITSRAEDLRRSRYFRDLVLSADAAKELRVFGLAPWVRARCNAAWVAAMAEVWRARGRGAPAVAVTMLLRGAICLVALWLIARAAVDHSISLGAAVAYGQAVNGAAVLSYTLGNPEILVQQGLASATPAADLEGRLAVANGEGPRRDAAGLPERSVVFDGVTFAYAGRDRPVFDSFDLTIEAGRSLAIVGDNGAGKTTLVKLLTGMYEPTGGRVLVDGIDLRDLDPRAWQAQTAAIFQDFARFPVSAAENIGWGAPGRPADHAAIRAAAEQAGIAEALDRLPSGFDTVLSRAFTGGADLSGGQWQRVALARALYATQDGARVLVLDEPTAHLDVRAEAGLYERFLSLTHGLTTVVISHRFSTVRLADRIVVVEHGQVVESGTHDQLVAAGGRYATMFALQASRYAEPER